MYSYLHSFAQIPVKMNCIQSLVQNSFKNGCRCTETCTFVHWKRLILLFYRVILVNVLACVYSLSMVLIQSSSGSVIVWTLRGRCRLIC